MNVPLRVLIVDDEPPARRIIAKLLTRYCDDIYAVATAGTVAEAVDQIAEQRPDLLLLDVELGEATGFDLLTRIDTSDIHVAFITAYSSYAIEAFRVEATDYLVKPVEIAALRTTIERVRDRIRLQRGGGSVAKLMLPGADGRRMLAHDEIVFIEADGSYSTVCTAAGESILVVRKLGQLEEDLASDRFFRCHRSYVINLAHVRELRTGEVVMSDGGEVPVSRVRRVEIQRLLRSIT